MARVTYQFIIVYPLVQYYDGNEYVSYTYSVWVE